MTRLSANAVTDDQLDALVAERDQLRQHRRLLTAAITRARLTAAAGGDVLAAIDTTPTEALADAPVLATLTAYLSAADEQVWEIRDQAARYRLAWQSARRRAAEGWSEYADRDEQYAVLAQAVARVRALHSRAENNYVGYDTCNGCELNNNELVPWPCPTMRALDGTEAAPAPAATEQADVTAHQPAYDAVYAYIRNLGDELPTSTVQRNAMIWRAVNAALNAAPAATEATAPQHIGGGANAEDCPACHGTNPPYPFICPGEETTA
ncbi:hypothetical protein [Streptomyces sp. MJP52]|uniref:hypothetical protein n=1 Tax=Streptomyces sp. MJP52 TaxID=2940555 RepID=UPI002475DB4C|nr:hypothetical protein [Streptomyces sp. MJP52]MDH6226235.1 hypothetical protein [Streptomyces sp. MJP52]